LALIGDWVNDLSVHVNSLLDDFNIDVLVYSGMLDFICNWQGGEYWTNDVPWSGQQQFTTMRYTDWVMGGNSTAVGHYKRLRNFTFLKIENAGHMVPLDQPQVALAMLTKFFKGQFN